jgi:EAL domain-containing protein (putative c-di-GMP-specific phosphodiesterase class I)/CheY-like chemotaxis protein
MNSLSPVRGEQAAQCVIIDDDPDICELISRVLGKIGVSSVGVSSAGALERALEAIRPSVVFLDVALDRSDAIDGIRILRETSFAGAVQLISGKDQELLNDIKAIGERHGLRMLVPLQKPFRSEHLRKIFDNGQQDPAEPAPAADLTPRSNGQSRVPQVDLLEAVREHWLDLAYQPKIDLRRTLLVGAEGLARINHPLHGLLGPASFLPGAADEALFRLTEFAIKKAFLDWGVMRKVGCNLHLAVNAPVQALTDPRLIGLVRDNHPRSAEWPGLILEVTEDEAVKEFDAVSEAAVQLRIYNVKLALDDFGSGYSSFARLKQFPFVELKLDRSYVQDCATVPMNARICQSIVDLARASGASCVAEGIETTSDCIALIKMGCDIGQGYLFGRPMSVGKLIAHAAEMKG